MAVILFGGDKKHAKSSIMIGERRRIMTVWPYVDGELLRMATVSALVFRISYLFKF